MTASQYTIDPSTAKLSPPKSPTTVVTGNSPFAVAIRPGADVLVKASARSSVKEQYGPPASTLTDNGRVYTARFGGGRNAFEYLLPILGVRQKNGSPGHPKPRARSVS